MDRIVLKNSLIYSSLFFFANDVAFVHNVDASNIDFGEYNIYVLTSVLKAFFRDMPEPLLTFDLYEDFIRTAGECVRKQFAYLLRFQIRSRKSGC